MSTQTKKPKARVIAFYLPQFHPFKENDEWWGKGYTEWISVARARKLFPGHEQPKLPGELGFYDLRLPETREAQAAMAQKYGVDGFCYYYYRLRKGCNLMDRPLKEVLASGKPDFPFMLCWANHNWEAKDWNKHDSYKSRMLVRQEYGDENDIRDYFMEVLPYFLDSRYIKEENCPLFAIYKPLHVTNMTRMMEIWNNLAKQYGFEGVKFIAYTEESQVEFTKLTSLGFSLVISNRMNAIRHNHSQIWRYINATFRYVFSVPYVAQYKNIIKELTSKETLDEQVIPTMMPNWDPSPRRGSYSHLWINSTPSLFKQHVKDVLSKIKHKQNKLVFIKSWNEWGEGNYLEPDRKWQSAYLEALKEVRNEMDI